MDIWDRRHPDNWRLRYVLAYYMLPWAKKVYFWILN